MTDKNQAAILIKSLERISTKIRALILSKGILELVTVLIGGLTVLFLLDVTTHFPYPLRLILFLGGTAYAVYRFVSGPLKKSKEDISPEDVSLLVEKEFPEFRSRVISTLQFNKNMPKANVSFELIGGMMKQTFSMVKNVTLGKIIDKGWQKKTFMTLLITLCIGVLLAGLMPGSFKLFLQRLVMPVNYPTKTKVVNIQVPEYLVAGEKFIVRVKAEGQLPLLGTVTLKTLDDRLDTDLTKLDPEGNYEAKLNGILNDGTFEISLGDYVSKSIDLKIINRPAISEINLTVEPPYYTGLKAFTQRSGNVQIPAGSRVKLEIVPNKQIKDVTFINKSESSEIPEFKEVDGNWVADFIPADSINYTLSMLDSYGLISKEIPDFKLSIKEDKKPFIRIIKPSSLNELSAKSSMYLEAKVSDDYSLSSIKITYSISNGNFDNSAQQQEFTVRKELNNIQVKEYRLKELWENRDLDLAVGNLLKIRIEAVDNSPVKNTALSEEILIPIISETDLRMRLSQEFVDKLQPVEDLKLKLKKSNRVIEKGDK